MQIAGLAGWAAAVPETIPIHTGETIYVNKPDVVDKSLMRCFAALATVTALSYCHQRGHTFIPPCGDRPVTENMLLMMGFLDKTTGRPDPVKVQHFDKLWLLYADHEMSSSTAAMLHTASVGADPLTCEISAIAAASGPFHGGAIDMVWKMFERVGSPENIPGFMEHVRRKEVRVMGVGHRIYKTEDPRAKLLRARLYELREQQVGKNLAMDVAVAIDDLVRNNTYFISRNLCINADLYGSLVFAQL